MNDFDTKLKELARAEDRPLPEGFEDRLAERLARLPERKRAGARPVRWILVAACLCMALVGTAAAVQSGVLYRFFQGSEGLGGFLEHISFDVAGYYEFSATERFQATEFSDGAREAAKRAANRESGAFFGFESWEAAEEFVGIDVLNNAFLAECRMSRKHVLGHASGCCIVQINADAQTGEPVVARLNGCYMLDGIEETMDVTATLVTDQMPYENAAGKLFPYSEEDLTNVTVEQYVTAAGVESIILRDTGTWKEPEEGYVRYNAFVTVGRTFVNVELYFDAEKDETQYLTALKQVLDGFTE